jgi:hypothetical protein
MKSPDKLKRGDTVICIHDGVEGFEKLDRAVVKEPFLPGCGHMMLAGSAHHYHHEDFEVYDDTALKAEKVIMGIEDKTVIDCFNRFVNVVAFNQHQGVIDVSLVNREILVVLQRLGLKDKYFDKLG